MAKTFIPKLIAEQMKYKLPSEENLDEAQQFLQNLMLPPGKESKPLNLDEFFTWVIGSTFLKKAYDGPYAPFNRSALLLCDRERKKGTSYKELRHSLRDSAAFATMIKCFDRHRQAYSFDADFAKELTETTAVHIPVSILMHAPFRCFYLDVENLDFFSSALGFYAYIGWDEKTRLPNLAIFRVFDPENASGQVPIKSGYYSGTDMMKQNLLYLEEEEAYLRFEKQPEDEQEFAFFFLLQTVLYLASREPDITKRPARKRTGEAKRPVSVKDINCSEIGIRYGQVIRKQKRRSIAAVPSTGETSAPRKPITSHVRSAHWHHYWTGKGRTTLIVKWIPPTFVSAHGKELPITIHKIKD